MCGSTRPNPPTGNPAAGDRLMLSAASAGVFVLNGSSVPPLVPGTNYYLGFQKPGAANVTFVFQVAFGLAPTNNIFISGITATNLGGTNGFLLQWQGPTNFQYEIQWTTSLAPLVVAHGPEPGHQRGRDDDQRTLQFL